MLQQMRPYARKHFHANAPECFAADLMLRKMRPLKIYRTQVSTSMQTEPSLFVEIL